MSAELEHRVRALESEAETMLGMIAGLQTVVMSLIAMHPNHDQLQLHIAGGLEMMDKPDGPLAGRSAEVMRIVVEELQRLKPVRGKIDPLRGTGLAGS